MCACMCVCIYTNVWEEESGRVEGMDKDILICCEHAVDYMYIQ